MRIDGPAQTRGVTMGRFADASSATPRDVLRELLWWLLSPSDETLRYDIVPVASAWVQNPKRSKFQGAGRRLAAAGQPRAGSASEPARPETAGDTLRD
jgi:hypothetical protein